jgi:hypothetical protein
VCKGSAIPADWVVVGHYHNPACPEIGDNAWIIKRPGRREVVCADSQVPSGWRRVSRIRSASCPGDGDNAWIIERRASPVERD